MSPTCPIDGCSRPRKDDQLMCKAHWFKVPKDLRDKVWAAARKMWRNPEDEAAYEAWKEARDQAVHAVEAKEDERVT